MAEDKEKKADEGVSVRIPQRVLDQVEARLRKYPRPRPTRGSLLAEAWDLYEAAAPATPDKPAVVAVHHDSGKRSRQEEIVALIMASGDAKVIDALTQNIDVFYDRLRPAKKKRA